jgi:predicted DNA-binding protein (MmcQ/YjbR family)
MKRKKTTAKAKRLAAKKAAPKKTTARKVAAKKSAKTGLGVTLRATALSYPQTTEAFPWGECAIKVAGKAFLFLRDEGGTVSFSVKLPRSAPDALEQPHTEPTHYGLGKHGWVTTTVDGGRGAPVATFEAWLDESYRAVAPKSVLKKLAT